MASGVFQLIDAAMEEVSMRFAVPLEEKISIVVKYPSGMPVCSSFAEAYVRIHELLGCYASLLERDAEELRQFVRDAQKTDQA